MSKYRFEQIAFNCIEKRKPTEEDMQSYIGLEHLDSGSLLVSRCGSVVPIKGDKLVMHQGDVLFGKRNAYLRRAAVAPHDGLFSAHGMVLQPNAKVVDKDFFPFFIVSDYFFDAAIKISVGSLSPTINWSDLKVLEFELPDLEKQKELAKVLWAMDATKRSYQKLLRKTDELVKSQFGEMFGDPVTNPMGWEVKTLKEICSKLNDGTHFSPDSYSTGDYKYVTAKNIKPDGFDFSNISYVSADVANLICEDDSVQMHRIIQEVVPRLSSEYLVSEDEFLQIQDEIQSLTNARWLRKMYFAGIKGSKADEATILRTEYAYSELYPIFEKAAAKRAPISVPADKVIISEFRWISFRLLIESFMNSVARFIGIKHTVLELD